MTSSASRPTRFLVLALAAALSVLLTQPAAARDGAEPEPRPGPRAPPIQDCPVCPPLSVVPAGQFTMGSPDEETGRGRDEGPQRQITIPRAFALSRHEVTRGEYRAFLAATAHLVRGGCLSDMARKGEWTTHPQAHLWDPGFRQTDAHPVVCVGWDDAQAYADWLTRTTGRRYRLPTEAEWEYAARAGSTAAYPWGSTPDRGCDAANLADRSIGEAYPDWTTAACDDGAVRTAPVGSYRANAFGLHDMIGNVGEWVQDCATDGYGPPAADGAAVDPAGPCPRRVVRSSSWGSQPPHDRVANRLRYPPQHVDDSIGIRVVRELDPAEATPRTRPP